MRVHVSEECMIRISRVPGRLVTSGVAMLALGAVLPGLAAAQTASTPPGWVNNIASGTWAAISQNTLADVNPAKDPSANPNHPNGAPWRGNTDQGSVVTTWNGGAFATNYGTHGSLLAFGGGHKDYYGSEVYAFDMASRLWKRVSKPYSGSLNWPYASTAYPDGSPVPPHTYDYVDYHPGTNSFALLIGTPDGTSGFNSNYVAIAHLLDLDTGQWRRSAFNSGVGMGVGGISCYDRTEDVFWTMGAPSSGNKLTRFDPSKINSNGTVGTYTNYPGDSINIDGAAECDPVNRLFVYTQFRDSDRVYARDLKNPSATRVRLKETGDIPPKSGAHGWAWSDSRQAFIYWRRSGDVYEFKHVDGSWDTGNWRWTKLTSDGNSVIPQDPINGVFSRFRIARYGDEEVAVVVNRVNGPVYAFRLPAGNGSKAVSVNLKADPSTVTSGGQTTLIWSAMNASSCTASGGWSGSKPTSGTQAITSITTATQFVLDCKSTSGATGRATAQVTIASANPAPVANRAPTISGAPASTVLVNDTYVFTPKGSDADGDKLTFSVVNKPAWASFDAATGTLAGTPSEADLGTVSGIVIAASDGTLSKALSPFNISVIAYGSYGGTLSWNAPTTNALGQPLTYLAGYKIYYGKESRNYSHTIRINGPGASSHHIDGLTAGTYYFAVSSFDVVSNESVTSDEVKVVLGAGAGNPSGSTGSNPSAGGSSSGGNAGAGPGSGGGGTNTGSTPASSGGSNDSNASAGSGGGGSVRPFDVLLLAAFCGAVVRRRIGWRVAVNENLSGIEMIARLPCMLPERVIARETELFDGALSMTGMKALGATTIAAGLLISGAGYANDADFQARCKASGVLKCVGFDNSSEFSSGVNLFPAWDGKTRGVADTQIKASGASSLRFEIPSNSAGNTSGYSLWDMGKGFGPGSTFYVQFRQRFSPEMIDTRFKSDGFKQVIFHRSGSSCGQVELATQNVYSRGFPIMYTACGGRTLEDKLSGGDYRFQQGDYDCRYSAMPAGCALYRPNQWMTFSYKVKIGEWGSATSAIEAWIGYEGEPLKKWIDQKAFVLRYDQSASDTYSKVQLTPYQSKKDTSQNHATAYVWYDELIVSTQPIAGPNGMPSTPSNPSTPSTGSGSSPSTGTPKTPISPAPSNPSTPPAIVYPTVPPAPPAGVQFQF